MDFGDSGSSGDFGDSGSGGDFENSGGYGHVIWFGEKSVDAEFEKNCLATGVEKQRSDGHVIWIGEKSVGAESEKNCSATDVQKQRTSSSSTSRVREMKRKLGTASQPLCVDEDGWEPFYEDVDGNENVDSSEIDETCHGVGKSGSGKRNYKENKKEVCMREKSAKRMRIKLPKDLNVFKILINSIAGKGEVRLEDLVPPSEENNSSRDEISLPLKFNFGIDESTSPEPSDFEVEIEGLWAECDMAVGYNEIGSISAEKVENEDAIPSKSEVDRCILCRPGKHQDLYLNEEIGLVCKHCSRVQVEIRDIVPSFVTNPYGRSNGRESCAEKHLILSELENLNSDFASDSLHGFDAHVEGTVWDYIPGVKHSLYQHQREGFEFIWKHIAGTTNLENLKNSTNLGGNGCIISHAPGTGKTRLTVVFLQAYMSLNPRSKPIIIAPCNMLLTWEEEFQKWKVDIPFHNLNKPELSGKEDEIAATLMKQEGRNDTNTIRMVKLYSWDKGGSILAIGYQQFEILVTRLTKKNKGNVAAGPDDTNEEAVRKILLEHPDLIVLDEGHTPRNERSEIWNALSGVKTERRILLSGTPFQNSLRELYNTLCLVRPKYAKKFETVRNALTNPSQDARFKEIKNLIKPFVHIHEGSILQDSLPGLRETAIILKPFDLQKKLHVDIKSEDIKKKRSMLAWEHLDSVISVHPSLLPRREAKLAELFEKHKLESIRLRYDAGVKTKFLMELIRLCCLKNEKVLVFSKFIEPLILVKDQLESHLKWNEREVLCINGKHDVKERQCSMKTFNDPKSEARVLLASTRACAEGISLVGASRVVFLDIVWNPSVTRQAISRAYRLGQKKFVYVYHLITSGTGDGEKFRCQADKDKMSKIFFSSSHLSKNQETVSPKEDQILEDLVSHQSLKDIIEKIVSPESNSNLMETSFLGEREPRISSASDAQWDWVGMSFYTIITFEFRV
ncbi:hypothetical protein UlMin_001451 [Ulmus minor]